MGIQDQIFSGNLNASRDWGHAKDYVKAMWLILRHPNPSDFVVATGITISVRDFVKLTFEQLGVELEYKGKGVSEVGW